MREDPHPERRKLIEDIRQQSSVMHFEVKTGLIGQSHDLLEDKPHVFIEERVNEGIDDLSMTISGMLVQNDVILHEEVRDVVIDMHCFRDHVQPDYFIATVDSETDVL